MHVYKDDQSLMRHEDLSVPEVLGLTYSAQESLHWSVGSEGEGEPQGRDGDRPP